MVSRMERVPYGRLFRCKKPVSRYICVGENKPTHNNENYYPTEKNVDIIQESLKLRFLQQQRNDLA